MRARTPAARASSATSRCSRRCSTGGLLVEETAELPDGADRRARGSARSSRRWRASTCWSGSGRAPGRRTPTGARARRSAITASAWTSCSPRTSGRRRAAGGTACGGSRCRRRTRRGLAVQLDEPRQVSRHPPPRRGPDRRRATTTSWCRGRGAWCTSTPRTAVSARPPAVRTPSPSYLVAPGRPPLELDPARPLNSPLLSRTSSTEHTCVRRMTTNSARLPRPAPDRRSFLRATALLGAAATASVALPAATRRGDAAAPWRPDPDSRRFTLAVMPDTQYLFDGPSIDKAPVEASLRYLLEHGRDENIVFLSHLGDLTQNGTRPKYAAISEAFTLLDRRGRRLQRPRGQPRRKSSTDDQRGATPYLDAFGPRPLRGPARPSAAPPRTATTPSTCSGGRPASGWCWRWTGGCRRRGTPGRRTSSPGTRGRRSSSPRTNWSTEDDAPVRVRAAAVGPADQGPRPDLPHPQRPLLAGRPRDPQERGGQRRPSASRRTTRTATSAARR